MKIKCKFKNPTAGDLGEALGLSQSSMDAISKGLDKMVKTKSGIVYMSEVVSYVEDLCNSQEELIWAFTNHIEWLALTGRLIPSIKKS
jgi:hypothetical protein